MITRHCGVQKKAKSQAIKKKAVSQNSKGNGKLPKKYASFYYA
jgi:hypothetical protein